MSLNQKFMVLVSLVLCSSHIAHSRTGCNIRFPIPHDNHQPLILQNRSSNYEFVIPNRGEIQLKTQESLILVCTEPRSLLEQSNANVTQVKCVEQSKFSLGRYRFEFNEFNCTKPAKATIRASTRNCAGNRGTINEIGYAVGRSFLTLLTNCYGPSTGTSYYTEHIMYGQSIANNSRTSKRPSFSTQGAGNNPVSLVYKQEFQKGQFNKLLQSAKLAESYINEKSYLARGHLAPDADFLFAPWQFSTYFYVNVVPQWQSINGGNWNSLERTLRKQADKLKQELTVITGTHDILKIKDINGNDVSIFLSPENKIPVPKFIYKILYDKKSKQGIVFVNLNDPFVKNITSDEYLCDDICDESGWANHNWRNPTQGLIYCCEYSDFKRTVKTAPSLSVSNILRATI